MKQTFKWLYHGIIYYLESSEYPDRYYVLKHELPLPPPDRVVTLVGPRVYRVGALLTVNKYEFIK